MSTAGAKVKDNGQMDVISDCHFKLTCRHRLDLIHDAFMLDFIVAIRCCYSLFVFAPHVSLMSVDD